MTNTQRPDPLIDIFLSQFADRLVRGGREHGGHSHLRPFEALEAERLEELLDVAGWSFILWKKIKTQGSIPRISAQNMREELDRIDRLVGTREGQVTSKEVERIVDELKLSRETIDALRKQLSGELHAGDRVGGHRATSEEEILAAFDEQFNSGVTAREALRQTLRRFQ